MSSISSNSMTAVTHSTNITKVANELEGSLTVDISSTNTRISRNIRLAVNAGNRSVDGIREVLNNDATNIVQVASAFSDQDYILSLNIVAPPQF